MDAQRTVLQEEKTQLLQRLAGIEVEQQRLFDSVPHFSLLETAAHSLGQKLSRLTQQRAAGEVAATSQATSACPQCEQNGAEAVLQMRAAHLCEDGRLDD